MFHRKSLTELQMNIVKNICPCIVGIVSILCVGLSSYAQSGTKSDTVSGVITDNEGEPVVGAFVFYKGTKNGVSSDLDGRYSISAPSEESVLVFQYLGMETFEKNVIGGGF